MEDQKQPKRKYNAHTTQCKYIKRDKTQCTRNARGDFCCHHKPSAIEKNREIALKSYYNKQNKPESQ